jgi:hypothetical protein
MKYRFFAVPVLLLLAGCSKDDVIATFTLSNSNPGTNETVTVSGVTTNATEYRWLVDNTFYSDAAYPTFTFNASGTSHTVRLEVKNGKSTGMLEKTINVVPKGKVTFWQNTTLFSAPVIVNVIAFGSDTITAAEATAPACNDPGCAIFFLAPATYSFTATQQWPATQTWSGNVTITDGGCAIVEVN